jgi:integrase
MPLKLTPPRNAKTKNLYIRGSYLGIAIDKSSGTDKRSVARAVLKRLEGQIERGEYPPREISAGDAGELTFIKAAVAYLEAGHQPRYVATLIKHFGETPVAAIDQAAIDAAAVALNPGGTPMTRNRYVHTPVAAILHHAGVDITIRRPKGWQGRVVSDWLNADDAFGIIAGAETFDPEIAALLAFLLYTGARISAALDLRREDLRLDEGRAWARSQKGQPHMDVRLRADLCERLAALIASHDRQRVFRLHLGAQLYHQLTRAKLAYLRLPCPVRRPVNWIEPPNRLEWVTFHTFRHTWATWMRQAGTDIKGLVATGNWRSERSANRYAHAVARDEWERVEKLPTMKRMAK